MAKKFSLKKSPTSEDYFVKKGSSMNHLFMPRIRRKKKQENTKEIIFMGRKVIVKKIKK